MFKIQFCALSEPQKFVFIKKIEYICIVVYGGYYQ